VPVLLQAPVSSAHAAHLPPAAVAAPDHGAHMDHAAHGHGAHMDHAAQPSPMERQAAGLAAVAVHTAAMFAAMAAVAVLVYEKLGLAVLRRAWVNLDLLWACSLIVAGALSWPWPGG